MAITTTWSVESMERTTSDGGVFSLRWELMAQTDAKPIYRSTAGDKLTCTPDPSASDYIPYADLTEADVLGWVYESLREYTIDEDHEFVEFTETAAEAKARVEADRTAKVQKQIDAAAATASGMPWTPAPAA